MLTVYLRKYLLFVIFLSFSSVIQAGETMIISIYGKTYQAELSLNKKFIKSDAEHYTGRLKDTPDNWLRLSEKGDQWQGLLHLQGDNYEIRQQPLRNNTLTAELISGNLPLGDDRAFHDFRPYKKFRQNQRETVSPSSRQSIRTPSAQSRITTNNNQTVCSEEKMINGVCLFAKLELAFDAEYQEIMGEDSVFLAESLANMVEGFYLHTFGIGFETLTIAFPEGEMFPPNTRNHLGELILRAGQGKVAALTHLYNERVAGNLDYLKSNDSIFLVVTGHPLSNAAGVAYTGGYCDRPYVAGALSELYQDQGEVRTALTAIIIAHEIGHTFGAIHDGMGNSCDATGYIMAADVAASEAVFSSCSVDSIRSKVNAQANGRCMSFPMDLAFAAAENNPEQVLKGEIVDLDYELTNSFSFRSIPRLDIYGHIEHESLLVHGIRINGETCRLQNHPSVYGCILKEPALNNRITFTVEGIKPGSAEISFNAYTQRHPEFKDLNSENDTFVSRISIANPDIPPQAPTRLKASMNGENVFLNWTDNSNNETSFAIFRSKNSRKFRQLELVGSGITQFTDTAVIPGNRYSYRVVALNNAGESRVSNTVQIHTPGSKDALTLSLDHSLPINEGSLVQVSVSNSSDKNYEYQFLVKNSRGETIILNDWSTSTTASWNSQGFSGKNHLKVKARRADYPKKTLKKTLRNIQVK